MVKTNMRESEWYSDVLNRKKWKEAFEQCLHMYNQQQKHGEGLMQ